LPKLVWTKGQTTHYFDNKSWSLLTKKQITCDGRALEIATISPLETDRREATVVSKN